MTGMHEVLHGLAVKKHAKAKDVAELMGVDGKKAGTLLDRAVDEGRALNLDDKYTLTALGRIALDSSYSLHYSDLRENEDFFAAYEAFEKINVQLKELITDWQTMEVGGERVANDHSNKDHDMTVIDRLGDLHEKADQVLARLAKHVSRMKVYQDLLLEALEKAEDGEIEWVSDAKIASYHTVWFELHEDLLRLLGQTRQE
mgnify:CR=1 FL=1